MYIKDKKLLYNICIIKMLLSWKHLYRFDSYHFDSICHLGPLSFTSKIDMYEC